MAPPRFLVLAAMPEEQVPFLAAADKVGTQRPGPTAISRLTDIVLDGIAGHVLLTGIGQVNAAAALSGWLTTNATPDYVLSVGSAGGLHENVKVGDVVVGTEYRYADVDAREFGYAFGQVPQMPETFQGSDIAPLLGADHVHPGLVVTSSSFISAENAAAIRNHFPHALAVDMESTALAHTCHLHSVRHFIAIRGISDLCTPRAGEEFHDGLGRAAKRSFETTRTLLTSV